MESRVPGCHRLFNGRKKPRRQRQQCQQARTITGCCEGQREIGLAKHWRGNGEGGSRVVARWHTEGPSGTGTRPGRVSLADDEAAAEKWPDVRIHRSKGHCIEGDESKQGFSGGWLNADSGRESPIWTVMWAAGRHRDCRLELVFSLVLPLPWLSCRSRCTRITRWKQR